MKRKQIKKEAIKHLPLYLDKVSSDDDYLSGKRIGFESGFVDGAQWRINSVWHKIEDEVPQATGEYKDDVYPQIPCLVHGYIATGYGYGVRYWNVTEQLWDEEGGDGPECDKYNIKEWCYLDDLLPERKDEAE